MPLRLLTISDLIFLLFAGIFLCVAGTAIAEKSPEISAVKRDNRSVTVKVTTRTKANTDQSYIVVARAAGNSSKFATIVRTKMRRHNTVSLIDGVVPGETFFRYKSKIVGRLHSNWSKTVTVQLPRSFTPTNPISDPDAPISLPSSTPTPVPEDVPSPVPGAGIFSCSETVITEAFSLINKARSLNNLAPLARITSLVNSSQNFSFAMAEKSVLSHDGWFANMVKFGFSGSTMGQNIGYMSNVSPLGMVNAWMTSEGHRKNILTPAFRYTGVGCAIDSQGLVWWTQDFGG